MLTALDRHAMATAPLHAFTSPVAGTGKSLLVDLASLLASGELTPVISQGSNKDETEKRLGAELLSGNAIVSFDNCSSEVDSELLCQALTQRELRVRELGYSRNVRVPITALFTVNGNNLVIANDLTRRTLLGQLDAGMERPETRTFKRKVDEVAREHRGALVAAALTFSGAGMWPTRRDSDRNRADGLVRGMVATGSAARCSGSTASILATASRPSARTTRCARC